MTTTVASQPPYSAAVAKLLQREPALLIDGRWVTTTSGQLIDVFDPSTGRKISEIADASITDCDAAVQAARRAFDDGRWTGLAPVARERLVNRLADLLETHADELAELEAIDNGKPKKTAELVDIPFSVAALRYMAGWITKVRGEHGDPSSAPSGAFHAYVRREPIGVAVQITPWNFPLIMATAKIAPALSAGCTVVLKPAEQTSLTALRLGDLVLEAGFPAGVVNIVTGRGASAGGALTRHPGVDKIAFTGSTVVGKTINRVATDTLKRVTLELGGKSPMIVMPDVDIPTAASGAANAIFFNSGQVCIAGSRLFAHRSVFDKLAEAVVENARNWRIGPALDPESMMGPLVSDVQRTRVMGYIDQGRKAGASVLTGGKTLSSDGYYVEPTVLVDVTPTMSVVREEIFGPVVVVQRFDDVDSVIAQANDTEYGLAASVWTKDLSVMHKVAAKLKAGTVWGNCHLVTDFALPFGGFKQSGTGREYGQMGIEAYTETKTVMIAL
jgi:phenylacetaldehyde dehydrogenase